MSRSYICKKCEERKRPVDPAYDTCKVCRKRKHVGVNIWPEGTRSDYTLAA